MSAEKCTKNNDSYNCVVLLGPTAVGKTAIGVELAHHFAWSIISADSRQVYKGLDIGSGKDIADYTVVEKRDNGEEVRKEIPHYLIDIATLADEYNVFKYQNDFYKVFSDLTSKNEMPFVVGGTGMYVDAVVRGYDLVPVPKNEKLHQELESKSLEELADMLIKLKPTLHNKSDLLLKDRVVHAIEIELYVQSPECVAFKKTVSPRPNIKPFVMGTTLPRELLHKNIAKRLEERLNNGMLEEVEGLHKDGISWERLEKLGLEYRFVSEYLEGKIDTKEALFIQLNHAISQFAKRQETWFRGMERKGVVIHWLPPVIEKEARYDAALTLLKENVMR